MATLLGCAGCAWENPPPRQSLAITVWFAEEPAFHALLDVVHSRIPNLDVTYALPTNCSLPFCPYSEKPDCFQQAGGSVLKTRIKNISEEWKLEPIDALSAEQGWAASIAAPVLASLTRGGMLYAAPLDVQRDNTLFYRKDVFADSLLTPPHSIADFFTAADVLKAKGITPLAVSASGGWTIASTLFEGVLVAEAGPQFYLDYFAGQKPADAPEIGQALVDLDKIMAYANDDRSRTGWGDAVRSFCAGQAAMLIIPDFARTELERIGCGADTIGYVSLEPRDTPSFLFVTGGFGLVEASEHRDNAVEFLRIVGSKEGQEAFNSIVRSTPSNFDVDRNKFDALSQQTIIDFQNPAETLALGYATLASASFQEAVSSALQGFVDPSSPDHGNVDSVLTVLRENYGSLKP